jgi:hypothetical protein
VRGRDYVRLRLLTRLRHPHRATYRSLLRYIAQTPAALLDQSSHEDLSELLMSIEEKPDDHASQRIGGIHLDGYLLLCLPNQTLAQVIEDPLIDLLIGTRRSLCFFE